MNPLEKISHFMWYMAVVALVAAAMFIADVPIIISSIVQYMLVFEAFNNTEDHDKHLWIHRTIKNYARGTTE